MSGLVERLRALDTCAVSDALDRFGLVGALSDLAPLAADQVMAGRAVTVLLGPPPRGAASGAPRRHLGTAAVEAAGPDDVIVVAHQGRTDCAGWGGLLSRAAGIRGVEGVVVDGAVRDLHEARSVGLPVHARNGTPVTARGRATEHAWQVAVEIGGVPVSPGDLVLGDTGGVVVVPAARAEDVITVAEQIAATEVAMATAIEAGDPVSSVMGRTYEEMTTSEQ